MAVVRRRRKLLEEREHSDIGNGGHDELSRGRIRRHLCAQPVDEFRVLSAERFRICGLCVADDTERREQIIGAQKDHNPGWLLLPALDGFDR